MPDLRVKICGLTRAEDARSATELGADYLGAILSEGFDRSVPVAVAREFTRIDGPALVAVLVDEPIGEAVAKARQVRASVIQLHGEEPPSTLAELRREGSWAIWKAVRPRTDDELRRAAERYAEQADALLIDGWHRERGGGAGVMFPWDILERVRGDLPPGLALVTAGGLTPETVAEAVARLVPDVVDVASGVESERGKKDPAKVHAFIQAARGAREAS